MITENDQPVMEASPTSAPGLPGVWLLPVALLIFYPPFFRGLFFSQELLLTHVLTSAVFILFCLRKWRNGATGLVEGGMDWPVLLLVGAYLLSLPGAVNMREALEGFYKVLNYFMIYWLVREVAVNLRISRILLIVLFTSSLGVALIGIAAALGYISYPGAFDGRYIMSTLQYVNAASVYMGIMSIIGISLAVTENRLPLKAFYGLATFMLMVVMLNASSKGAWIAVLASVVVYLAAIQKIKRLESVYLFITTLTAAAVVSMRVLPFLITKEPVPPAANTIISELGGLTEFGSSSFMSRLDFYSDALEIIRDYIFFGTGAGGWNSLYHRYQDYLYWTTEVHNHFLQAGVEAGLPGLLAWFGIFCVMMYCLYRLWRRRDSLNPSLWVLICGASSAALGLVSHSLIDFDLSIPSLQILLFALLGLITGICNAEFKERPGNENGAAFRVRPGVSRMLSGLVMAFALLLLTTAGLFALAAFHAERAEKAVRAGQYPQALNHYENATRFDPLNGRYYAGFARFCAVMWSKVEPDNIDSPIYKQAVSEAGLAEGLAWNDYKTMVSIDETYRILGNEEDMVRTGKRVIELNPWVIDGYDRLLGTYVGSISQWIERGDPSRARDGTKVAVALAEQLRQQMSRFKGKGDWEGQALEFNDSFKIRLAQVYFHQGNYKEAVNLLESCVDEELTRGEHFQALYAAALHRSGQQEAAAEIIISEKKQPGDFQEAYDYFISLQPLNGSES